MFDRFFDHIIKKEPEKLVEKQKESTKEVIKLTAEQLALSEPYEDVVIKLKQKINFYIKPDGTEILVDRKTGKVPFLFENYEVDENSEAVKKLREKFKNKEN